jgi:hypothetical protein
MRGLAQRPNVPALRLPLVDARHVAVRIVEPARASPGAGRTRCPRDEAAGADYLTTAGKRHLTVPVRLPGKAGKAYRDGQNLTLDGDRGTRTWEEFLADQPAPVSR